MRHVRLWIGAAGAALAAVLIGCSLLSPESPSESTGSVAPRILFKTLDTGTSITFDEVIRNSLKEIEIQVTDSKGGVVSQSFAYSDHRAVVSGIAAGHASLRINAKDIRDVIIMTCGKEVEVVENQTASPPCTLVSSQPNQPYLSVPRQVSLRAIRLQWTLWGNNSTAVDTVIIERMDGGSGSWVEVGGQSPGQFEYIDQNNVAPQNINYRYRIKILMTGGITPAYSNEQSITTTETGFPAALEIPQITNATALSSTKVNLFWSYRDTALVSGFLIERSDDSGVHWNLIGSVVPQLSYTDQAVFGGNQYSYRIRAVSNSLADTSGYSNVYQISVAGGGPAAPTNLRYSLTGGLVKLQWDYGSGNIAGFEIERRNVDSAWNQVSVPSSAVRDFQESIILPAAVYEYRIRVKDLSNAYSDYSVLSVDLSVSGPAMPANFRYTVNVQQVDLQWDYGAGNVSGFEIERSTDAGASWTVVADLTSPTQRLWTDTDIQIGNAYKYRMKARDAAVYSTYTIVLDVSFSGGSCPTDMYRISGYCVDRQPFGQTVGPPAQGPTVNISFDMAGDSCVAKGKRLCDKWEWQNACDSVVNGTTGIFYDFSGAMKEWVANQGASSPPYDIAASFEGTADQTAALKCQTTTLPRRGDADAGIGFRCCK